MIFCQCGNSSQDIYGLFPQCGDSKLQSPTEPLSLLRWLCLLWLWIRSCGLGLDCRYLKPHGAVPFLDAQIRSPFAPSLSRVYLI